MAAPRRRRRAQSPAADTSTPKREVNLTGFSDDELRDLTREHDVDAPDDADREALLAALTPVIAEKEAADRGAAGDDIDNANPEAGDDEPALNDQPRTRRRSSGDRPVAKRDILHAGRVIPAGTRLPDSVPDDSLPTLREHGAID